MTQTQTKPAPETLVSRIVIGRKQLEWIASGLSTDYTHVAIGYAVVTKLHGHSWLCSTDTARLFMLKIAGKVPEGQTMIDLRRILHEMRFLGPKAVSVGLVFTAGVPSAVILNDKGDVIDTLLHDLHGKGTYPSINRVCTNLQWERPFHGAAFNFRLLQGFEKIAGRPIRFT